MATIWDAEVPIWAAPQIVEARDAGWPTSRLIAATPHEILAFVGRERWRTRLPAPSRPPSTGSSRPRSPPPSASRRSAAATASPGSTSGRKRPTRTGGRSGSKLILPDWFYAGVLEDALVPDHRPGLFLATGGLSSAGFIEIVRKHGGRSGHGWSFDFRPSPRQVWQPLAAQASSSTTFATSFAASRCRATASRSNAPRQAQSAFPSNPRPSICCLKGSVAAASHSLLGISCEFPRAIGDRRYRAIGDRIHVLSGTGTARKTKQLRWLGRP